MEEAEDAESDEGEKKKSESRITHLKAIQALNRIDDDMLVLDLHSFFH